MATPSLTPEMIERQKLMAEGMAQFERLHAPVVNESETEERTIICAECGSDFPCERMVTMLIVQGLTMFQSMIPSGNMGAILGRFAGGGNR